MVKPRRLLFRHRFCADFLIADLDTGFQAVQIGNLDQFFAEVNTGDIGAELGQSFAENTTPATDIDNTLAADVDKITDKADAQRIDIVQRFKFPVRIPPALGQRPEFMDFVSVYVFCCSHIKVQSSNWPNSIQD